MDGILMSNVEIIVSVVGVLWSLVVILALKVLNRIDKNQTEMFHRMRSAEGKLNWLLGQHAAHHKAIMPQQRFNNHKS